jgi:hypothetical protein
MDFETFAGHELSELARRLTDAAARQSDAATARATAAFQTTLDKLREDYQQLTTENERLSAERAALLLEKSKLAESARRLDRGLLLERLLAVFERIDRGVSVDEVLGAAADGFADDFSRVVVLRAEGAQLTVTQQRGHVRTGPVADTATLLNGGSWLAHAARMQSVRVFDQHTKAAGDTPFGGQPSVIVTAPIVAHGELLALLYADDDQCTDAAPGSDSALRLAGVIQRHAALRLERLTIELKALAELRAYAQMLLDEVEYVYAADGAAQKPPQEQRARLTENLRCARNIFQQRVTLEGPAAAALLDEIITKTVAAKSGTPFGTQLAEIAA